MRLHTQETTSNSTGQYREACLSITTLYAICVLLALEVSNTMTILAEETCTLSTVIECWEYVNSPG